MFGGRKVRSCIGEIEMQDYVVLQATNNRHCTIMYLNPNHVYLQNQLTIILFLATEQYYTLLVTSFKHVGKVKRPIQYLPVNFQFRMGGNNKRSRNRKHNSAYTINFKTSCMTTETAQ